MKAVIFDRDGVIIDSESTNIESAVRAFKVFGITIAEDEKEWIIGRHPEDYCKTFSNKYRFSFDIFKSLQRKNYYALLDSTPVFTKIVSLIRNLHERRIPLGLTTSAGVNSTQRILKDVGLENVFDVIVTSEDYTHRKPNPEPYLVTTKKLNLKPLDCVVIEDTCIGVEAAKNAGMKCIALPNSYTKHQDFSKADLVVNSADQIDFDIL